MMHYYGGWGYNSWGFPSMLFSIFFWIIIIVLLVKLITHMGSNGEKEKQEKDQTENNKYLDIIMERYAKGEINKKEYEQLKNDLE